MDDDVYKVWDPTESDEDDALEVKQSVVVDSVHSAAEYACEHWYKHGAWDAPPDEDDAILCNVRAPDGALYEVSVSPRWHLSFGSYLPEKRIDG